MQYFTNLFFLLSVFEVVGNTVVGIEVTSYPVPSCGLSVFIYSEWYLRMSKRSVYTCSISTALRVLHIWQPSFHFQDFLTYLQTQTFLGESLCKHRKFKFSSKYALTCISHPFCPLDTSRQWNVSLRGVSPNDPNKESEVICDEEIIWNTVWEPFFRRCMYNWGIALSCFCCCKQVSAI